MPGDETQGERGVHGHMNKPLKHKAVTVATEVCTHSLTVAPKGTDSPCGCRDQGKGPEVGPDARAGLPGHQELLRSRVGGCMSLQARG